MDGVSLNTEPVGDEEGDYFEIEGDSEIADYVDQNGIFEGENPLPPAVGMEFESYEDVYYFYSCYAKEQGFGVRVSNTWYRKSKEKYRGKLSCSSAGFKKKSEANRPRPETRTGCPAMIKFRLMDTRRWRIIEVELDHNHLINPTSGKFYKSHKNLGVGTKRLLQLDSVEEVQKVRLFQTVVIDADHNGYLDVDEGAFGNRVDNSNQLKLNEGDALAIEDFLCQAQLTDSNFFYVLDLNEKGSLRNLFWVSSRSRAAYTYFSDVVYIDTSCLANKYQVPLVLIIGINHHGHCVLFGCGLLAMETVESYIWLFRAWLTSVLGRPPQVIIADQHKELQIALTDVFPRASHCISLSDIMRKVPQKLGGMLEYETIEIAIFRAVYHSLKPEQFDALWEGIIQQHRLGDHKWLQELYEHRRRWVPVFMKDTFLAGVLSIVSGDVVPSFFREYLGEHTSLKQFFEQYDQAIQSHHQLEVLADEDSKNSSFMLKSRCYFEAQLCKLYTNEILEKFEKEVEGMYCCFNTRKLNAEAPLMTYIVKEHVEMEGSRRDAREFEVSYNESDMEVQCNCGLFNSKGYLCRHALSVLTQNGIEEIPAQYILPRWRKDVKRNYILDYSYTTSIDTNSQIHRYDHIYRSIVQVIEEGRKSKKKYSIAVQGIKDILSKLRLGNDTSG
ncbi:protein FAR1-RELATED SEQUENCE 6-like [Cucumis melo]|uniref:Protein FAR1-RELATED SEQUENCE n=1 Tax=Cucumis melo TaxID=3656 RepID=A0A1S3BYS6_CUCME|nr:protein FAR1-RELATED SEQUENCE 6-like [Cucumis melo]XP_008454180.2 protein FAR1-RELATED SEQUENCE 6-like [Cucumis melo]